MGTLEDDEGSCIPYHVFESLPASIRCGRRSGRNNKTGAKDEAQLSKSSSPIQRVFNHYSSYHILFSLFCNKPLEALL